MASQSHDRLLWLGLGVSLFFAIRGIAAELQRVRQLTEIKHEEKDEHVLGEGTEDALKLETLQKLSESASSDLRAAALRIVSERSTKGSTKDLLLRDLARKDKVRRSKALTAMHFLVSNRALVRSAVSSNLKDLPTYRAVVDCLCHFLEEHTEETSNTRSLILPRTRPLGEKKALNTLNIILGENIPAALEAGVVSRWLAKYPFPVAIADESRRRDIVLLMKTWWADDSVMSSIVSTLSSHQEGIKQLRKHGLMGSMIEENDHDDDDGDSDVWMVGGEETAGVGPWNPSSRRPRDGGVQDQALRRRRREAMVFSEGGRPLNQDNIIQPSQNAQNERDEDLENQLEQLMEEVNREDEEEEERTWEHPPYGRGLF